MFLHTHNVGVVVAGGLVVGIFLQLYRFLNLGEKNIRLESEELWPKDQTVEGAVHSYQFWKALS